MKLKYIEMEVSMTTQDIIRLKQVLKFMIASRAEFEGGLLQYEKFTASERDEIIQWCQEQLDIL